MVVSAAVGAGSKAIDMAVGVVGVVTGDMTQCIGHLFNLAVAAEVAASVSIASGVLARLTGSTRCLNPDGLC